MAKHYIAMSGSHGCLPDFCQSAYTHDQAVDTLVNLFELGRRRAAILKSDNYLELAPIDGAQYCEIDTCECDDPSVHNDM